jgi:hypothetical protein
VYRGADKCIDIANLGPRSPFKTPRISQVSWTGWECDYFAVVDQVKRGLTFMFLTSACGPGCSKKA